MKTVQKRSLVRQKMIKKLAIITLLFNYLITEIVDGL